MDDVRFHRSAAGRLVVALHPAEVELLAHLADELAELLETPDVRDPAVDRLFPRAYLDPTEEEAEDAFSALVRPDLLRARLDALRALSAVLRATPGGTDPDAVRTVELEPAQEAQWLTVLNDARLALGTRLGITEEAAERVDRGAAPDELIVHAQQVYDWLTHLQGELVDVLLGELPETGEDA